MFYYILYRTWRGLIGVPILLGKIVFLPVLNIGDPSIPSERKFAGEARALFAMALFTCTCFSVIGFLLHYFGDPPKPTLLECWIPIAVAYAFALVIRAALWVLGFMITAYLDLRLWGKKVSFEARKWEVNHAKAKERDVLRPGHSGHLSFPIEQDGALSLTEEFNEDRRSAPIRISRADS